MTGIEAAPSGARDARSAEDDAVGMKDARGRVDVVTSGAEAGGGENREGRVARKARRKTYWQSVSLRSERDRNAVSSWFHPLSNGLTPYKADVLCDVETDAEKKVRVFMRDGAGREFKLERRYGVRHTTMTRKPVSGAK